MKMITIINITSYIGITNNAEHYYAGVTRVDTNENIYNFSETCFVRHYDGREELERELSIEESIYLAKKDSYPLSLMECHGLMTERFNSVEEIKDRAIELYKTDIIFLNDGELVSEDIDIITELEEIHKTGKYEIRN